MRKNEILEIGMTNNAINPPHYTQGQVECIDAIESATTNKPGLQAFCVGNVIKYLWRYEAKGGITDVLKAQWYLERLIGEMGRPVTAVESQKFSVDALRWMAVDLDSKVLNGFVDQLERGAELLEMARQHVPPDLSGRINAFLSEGNQ